MTRPTSNNSMLLYEDHNTDAGLDDCSSGCYLNGKLLIRKNSESPLLILSADTLKEDKEAMEAIKWSEAEGAITMQFTEEANKETGRAIGMSKIFTDNNFLYLVSTRNYVRPKDADEDTPSLPRATVIEQYTSTDYSFIKSVTLLKNEIKDFWAPKRYRDL